jgi:hypothetical protein
MLVSRSRSHFTTDSQSVCPGIERPCGTCDQILFLVGMLSEICGLVSMGRPFWQEDLKCLQRIGLLMSWGRPKCRHPLQQFMHCCDSWLPWKFWISGCCLDTDLGKLWEAPMEGSHITSRGDWCLGCEAYKKRRWRPEHVALVADISEPAGVTVAAGSKVCSWGDLLYEDTWSGVACCWYFPFLVGGYHCAWIS